MWLDEANCKLCIITSRTGDLIRLRRPDKMPDILSELSQLLRLPSRSEAFSLSFQSVAKLVGIEDPYKEYKAKLTAIGKRVAEAVRAKLEQISWDLTTALRIAAAANIVDTSVLGYRPKKLEEAVWDLPAIEEYVNLPNSVYYVLDNAGEAQIDLVVAEALDRNGIKPTFVVRSQPYEIDVLEDDIASYKVVVTPGNISPIRWLRDGFILAKGIANFEAYLEWGEAPALLLFRAKCDVLAKVFSVPRNAPIIISGDKAKAIGLAL
ncbi:ARMT1-like domain-containing protein [Pyrobaculum aerophilum]|uniref:Carboxylate--amine ligase n=1 Tax=Pyrobaculum aerophilum TaxID=13773 RepID=A0A371R5A0_9CREN|nr:ARMT1-like domain-containing protein [Pyrobaculum aerophilum]RFA98551.1 carboxylate--amine ligase [Pyrobaculum aerophilum]RFA99255.1 carboxylate--amine ligase [Pyrobaculum aerophilum]